MRPPTRQTTAHQMMIEVEEFGQSLTPVIYNPTEMKRLAGHCRQIARGRGIRIATKTMHVPEMGATCLVVRRIA